MKKILALLLAVVFVFALASCGAGEKLAGKTAKEAIEISNDVMSAEKALKTDITFAIGMAMGSMNMNLELNSSISALKDEKKPAFTATVTMPDLFGIGSPTATEMVYVDGVLYTKNGDEKVKSTLGIEEAMEQASATGDLDFISFFTEATIEKKDGKYVLSTTKIPTALLEGMDLPVDVADESLTINKLEAVMTPDGFLESITLDLAASADGTSITLTGTITFEKLPADFTVTAPADAADYVEENEAL